MSEKGLIEVYWGNKQCNELDEYADYYFVSAYKDEWANSSYVAHVLEVIDHAKLLAPRVVDGPWGVHAIETISGGAKLLITAYFRPNGIYPFHKIGDNCAKLLYEASLEKKTNWYYHSFVPKFVEEQKVLIHETGDIYTGRVAFRKVAELSPTLKEMEESWMTHEFH